MSAVAPVGQTTAVKQWLSSLIGSAPLGILAVDLDGWVTLANAMAAATLGTRSSAMVDTHVDELVAGWPALEERLAGQGPGRHAFDLVEVPRGDRIHDVRGRPVLDGLLVTFEDVTERVATREAERALLADLEAANRELTEFARICAHDVKSPVDGLSGLVRALEGRLDGLPSEVLAIVGMLRRSVDGLDATVRAINEAVVVKESLRRDLGSSHLPTVVAEVVASLTGVIEREGALVEVEVGAAGPVPLGAVHLRSVVANLLGNSLRYRDPARRPVVRVEASTDVDTTVLTVTDNGLGLDVERVGDRLFGLFNRFHTHVEGSGMGLHLTRSIVRAAGGDVTVESTPGAGATFRLELPHG